MAEINESKSETLYGCPECEKVCNAVEKDTCQRNKMELVAAMFGKKFGERFTVERDHDRFDCEFAHCGFIARGAYENPYMDFDCFILEDLLTGRAVIVDDDR